MIYTLQIKYEGKFEEQFMALDKSIQIRISKAVKKIQEKPELGKPLRKELAGYFSEHVGNFRVVYKYDDSFIYLFSCRPRKKGY